MFFLNKNFSTLHIAGFSITVILVACFSAALFFQLSFFQPVSDPLTKKERAWLEAHNGKIRLAPTPNWEPMEFFSKKGQYKGMVADFIKLIEKNLSFKFKLVHAKSWKDVLEMAKNREVDIISAAKPTPERIKYMFWTAPYLDIPNVIVTRKTEGDELTLNQLAGMTVGVNGSYAVVDYLEEQYPNLSIVKLESDFDGIRKVAFSELDALIVEFPYASYTIAQERITNLKVAGETDYKALQSIGIRNDWPILFSIMKKGLAQITPEKKREILSRWTYLVDYPFYYSKKFWMTVIFISVAMAFFAGLVLVWNKTLRYKVNKKTQELINELAQRKAITEELEKNRQRLSTLISNLPGMVYLCHHKSPSQSHWPEEFISHGCFELTGYRTLRARGTSSAQFYHDKIFHPDVRDQLKKEFKTLLTKNKPFHLTYPILTATGDKKWVWEQGVASHTDTGEVAFVEGFITDITHVKELERIVNTKDKMASLGHAAAGIAHEIRNPLSGINIYLSGIERLCEQYDDTHNIKNNIDLIREASNDIEIVIKRVLDFAKSGAPLIGNIDIKDPVEKALYLCEVFFRKNNIRVEKKIPDETLTCKADTNLIQRVVLNILTNAAEAMRSMQAEKIIQIKTYRENNSILIVISDSGPGIREKEEQNIFDPFYTTKKDGTGIGLSLSQRIIEDHFGEINVSTSTLGGAKFIIKLPFFKSVAT